ncbi:MAG: hypothetical protein KDC12_05665, partial [Flavobacteriales bacterium]|nr:hypothetical protein [Flavobacteriales bacterium]
MKKPLLILLCFALVQSFSAQENGGFESWTTNPTFDNPVVTPSDFVSGNDQFFWFTGYTPCTEVAGVNGSAMRLETSIFEGETFPGFAIWGQIPEGDELFFPGGFAFADQFVSGISATFRYDIDPSSPGFVLVQFKNNGMPV